MRFNSVRTSDYSQSAKAVNKATDQIFDAAMSGKPDFTKISQEAIKGRSLERRTATEAEGHVAKAGLDAIRKTKITRMKADTEKEVSDIKRPAKRMAGIVAGLGAIGQAAVTHKNLKEDKREREELRALEQSNFETQMEMLRGEQAGMKEWRNKIEEMMNNNPTITQPENTNSTTTPPAVETQTPPAADTSTPKPPTTSVPSTPKVPNVGQSFDLSSLSKSDYEHLAYAITSEAGGGKDKYGVAASILNRVQSKNWPGTVKDVIFQDGQYEGVYKGLSTWSPEITADLMSPQGQKELQNALRVLDGRTDFKGQTMLQHRSSKGNKDYDGDGKPDLDPMFDPTGNFFHYSHQT